MDMYIRIKRQKTTYFLQVQPTDTILEVKQKLQEYCEQVKRDNAGSRPCGAKKIKNWGRGRIHQLHPLL